LRPKNGLCAGLLPVRADGRTVARIAFRRVMDVVAILRELWLRRTQVVLAALISLCVAVVTAYKVTAWPLKLESRQYTIGIAGARVLLDTPKSKVVDLGAAGADSTPLSGRATLLSNLMASGPVKAAIARRAGISPDEFAAVPAPPEGAAPVAASVQLQPTEPGDDPRSRVLKIQTETDVPIISFQTQGPDAQAASRLANGAVEGLRDYLGSVAAAQRVPEARQLVVTQLGRARSATVERGPRRLYGVVIAFFLFIGQCAVALILPRIVRRWQAIVATEEAHVEPVEEAELEKEPIAA
jgi:hypothetical protein